MIKVEKIQVMNFEGAFRGLRNPLESWAQGDSYFGIDDLGWEPVGIGDVIYDYSDKDENNDPIENSEINNKIYDMSYIKTDGDLVEVAAIGPKDLALAQKLILAGSDHSKFMRQIFVSMDITAPLYWWKEMDTYKVGTVANSCSTMHKLASTPITREMFSFDKELNELGTWSPIGANYLENFEGHIQHIINICEAYRKTYLETKDIRYWRALIQLLPSSWNQTRTWTANYAVLRNIYFARGFHKLVEWREFCKIILRLPWGEELICVKQSDMLPEKNYRLFLDQ